MQWKELVKIAVKACKGLDSEYANRLKDEIKEIDKQGANDYWCELYKSGQKFNNNPNGLVFPWLVGITSVDPIEQSIAHNWFRHPDMPDIDIDFLPTSRSWLKQYVLQTYGREYVCSVGNWITYKPKSAILDMCRAYGANVGMFNNITSNLPDEFDELSLDELLGFRKGETEEEQQEADRFSPFYTLYDNYREIIEMAYRAVGMIKAHGTHAGGVIISNKKLGNIIPMSLPKSDRSNWVSQWTEGRNTQLSKFGLIKFDMLGLKTMQYIWRCCELIRENRGIIIDWSYMDPDNGVIGVVDDGITKTNIMMNDPESIEQINALQTDSIFQHETPIQKRIIAQGKVKDFWDMVAYSSLGRPGPMEMIPDYIFNRDDEHNRWMDGENEAIIDVLRDTHGVVCFQESLTALWIRLAGFTIPQAEEARKIVSKKWVDKLPMVRDRWMAGASKTLGKEKAAEWWNKFESFGRYCFNKSHAIAYSIISFRCLYLKAHFGPEWWAAVMSYCHPDKLTKYMQVARSEDVRFASLDVNTLRPDYAVDGNEVTLGLTSIKGVGKNAAEKFGVGETYNSFEDFIKKCGKHKIVMERFIKLGAFDRFHSNRRALWKWYLYKYSSSNPKVKDLREQINSVFQWSDKKIEAERNRQAEAYFKMYPKRKKLPKKIANWKPKIGHKFDVPSKEQVMGMFNDYEIFDRLEHEKEYLGYYWTNPLDLYVTEGHMIEDAKNSGELEAVIDIIEVRTSKKGNDYVVLYITDGEQQARVNMWESMVMSTDERLLKEGVGVRMSVSWNAKYKNFTLDAPISGLKLRPEYRKAQDEPQVFEEVDEELMNMLQETS